MPPVAELDPVTQAFLATLGTLALAIGIGLQNIPEGLAIALPLRRG